MTARHLRPDRRRPRPFWLLVALLLAACTRRGYDPQDRGPAAKLLAGFRAAVEESVANAPDGGGSADDVTALALAEVRRILRPNVALLHEQAKWQLGRLPRGRLADTAGWAQPDPGLGAFDPTRLTGLLAGRFGAPEDIDDALLLAGWNPAVLCGLLRSMVQARALGVEEYGRRSMLQAFAPPDLILVDPSPDAPVLALVSGREQFACRLRFDPSRGAYLPAGIDWREKRAEPPRPAAALPADAAGAERSASADAAAARDVATSARDAPSAGDAGAVHDAAMDPAPDAMGDATGRAAGRPIVVAGPAGLAVVGRDGHVVRRVSATPLDVARWLPGDEVLVALGADDRSIFRIEPATGASRLVATLPPMLNCPGAGRELFVGESGPEHPMPLRVQEDSAVRLTPGAASLCLELMDRNANMVSDWAVFRVDLGSGAVASAIVLPESCAASPPTGCAPEDLPEISARTRSNAAYPFDVDSSGRITRDGRVVQSFAAPVAVQEEFSAGRSPSGQWVVVAGGIEQGDYIWRSLWLVDRQAGAVFPIREGAWLAPVAAAAADPQATLRVAGESTLRWLEGLPDALVVDQLLVSPGVGAVVLPGKIAL